MVGALLIVCAFALLLSASGANATTYVYQDISTDTTWNEAGSPYVVNDTITVQSGATLTVGPNVNVRVDAGRQILIDGSLRANGEAARMINFTANSTTWNGMVSGANSLISLNYVKFNNATGMTVQNTGVFTNSMFRDLSSNAILFSIIHKSGNLTVTGCDFRQVSVNDILVQVSAWSNATTTRTTSVPIVIANNNFALGLTGTAVRIEETVNPVQSGVAVLNSAISVNNNRFNIGTHQAISVERTVVSYDNATATLNGALTFNFNTFTSGNAISVVNSATALDLPSLRFNHDNSVNINSGVTVSNNDLRNVIGNGFSDSSTLVTFGQKTSTMTNPIRVTGNNFTTSIDAIIAQKTAVAYENGTAVFASDITVDHNRMISVENGIIVGKSLLAVGDFNGRITYTGAETISNNTVTLGTGVFFVSNLAESSSGYGIVSMSGAKVVSDNTIANIGSGMTISVSESASTSDHSSTTLTIPVAVVRNNVSVASGLIASGSYSAASDLSHLTILGDVRVLNNIGSQLSSSGITLLINGLAAVDDGNITVTGSMTVSDNKLHIASGPGITFEMHATGQNNGKTHITMPIEISGNNIDCVGSNAVRVIVTLNTLNNALIAETGAVTIDSNLVTRAANGFTISRQVTAGSKTNSSVSVVSDVTIINNVMNNLTGNCMSLTDAVAANGHKELVFNSTVTVTGNVVHKATGRMLDISRQGLRSYDSAKLTFTGSITVSNNLAVVCGESIRLNLAYESNNLSTLSVTGDLTVTNNQGLDISHNGIEVYQDSRSKGNSTMSVVGNIMVSDNVLEIGNLEAITLQNYLVTSDNSTGTMVGSVNVLRNSAVIENSSALSALVRVIASDNSDALMAGDLVVSNNTMTYYGNNDGYFVDVYVYASVTQTKKVATATYNGDMVVTDNKATVTGINAYRDVYYVYFDVQAKVEITGPHGNAWANATAANVKVLRNIAIMNGAMAVGLRYDPDLISQAINGGTSTVTVGTQLVANNEVTATGDDFYGLYYYGDNLYSISNIGNATVVSGSISIRDNTVGMKGNNSIGLYVRNDVDNIEAVAHSHWLASFKLVDGLNIIRNSLVMKGSENFGILVENDGQTLDVIVDDMDGDAFLQYEMTISNNVLTMSGPNNVGIDLTDYIRYFSYNNGNVVMKADVMISNNNVKMNSDTGEGILLSAPLNVDVTSFNGVATISAKVSVINNIVTRGGIGIHVDGTGQGDVYITSNKVTGTYNISVLIEGANAIVENNIITENAGNGIVLQNNLASTYLVIGNNTITHNGGIGLWVLESNGVAVFNGIFEENMNGGIIVPSDGVVAPSDSLTLALSSGSQVKWLVSTATTVKGNDVELFGDVEITRYGILTLDSVDSFTIGAADTGVTQLMVDFGGSLIVRNSNMYSDNGKGLFLVYGKLQMTSSIVSDWSEIYLGNTSTASITACTIQYNDRNGIFIDGANPTISSTTILANGMDGIFVNDGSQPIIKSCVIMQNERGIYARSSYLDNVVDNIFVLNSVAGLYAEDVVGRIHANIFLLDKNEIFLYNCVVSVEDNEIGYARIVDDVAKYSVLLSLVLSYLDTSSLTEEGLSSGDLMATYGLSDLLLPMLLEHVGMYAINSDVTAKDNTYGMLSYAVYAENSTVSFSDTVKENAIVLQWLNHNLDSRNITVPTFVYNGIYLINSKLTMSGASIQCRNDAVFLDDSSALITKSALNASRFDIYSVHESSVNISATSMDGKLKIEDGGLMTWFNQFTVIVKNSDGKLVSGAPVTVVDGNGKLISSGVTDSNGQYLADVTGWTQDEYGRHAVSSPYWVNATVDGKVVSQTADGSQAQTVSAQAQRSTIDAIMLPMLLIVALIVVVVVIMVVLRSRK